MSKLLLNEEPLLIMPKLATKIGLNESIILQQIHYWLLLNEKVKNNYRDNFYWTYNSYTEWQEQFPFWSVKTIQRTIKNLQDLKLVKVGNYNKMKIDRTKWYRIDYDVLEILENSPFGQIDLTNRTEWLHHLDKLTKAIPETSTETTKEINDIYINLPVDDCVFFSIYNKYFFNKFNKAHMKLTEDNLNSLVSWVNNLKESFIEVETFEDAVKEHFKKLPKSNNGNILAFMKASHRYFEVLPEDYIKNTKSTTKGYFNSYHQRTYDGKDGGLTIGEIENKLLGYEQ